MYSVVLVRPTQHTTTRRACTHLYSQPPLDPVYKRVQPVLTCTHEPATRNTQQNPLVLLSEGGGCGTSPVNVPSDLRKQVLSDCSASCLEGCCVWWWLVVAVGFWAGGCVLWEVWPFCVDAPGVVGAGRGGRVLVRCRLWGLVCWGFGVGATPFGSRGLAQLGALLALEVAGRAGAPGDSPRFLSRGA